ncbi:YcxB family protein [Fodinicola feengrottensis]|uniref:YcxB family protein n=1 Tax=Fodinicola feengrottensis TaxID=435914 RepID=UPI0013D44754|nr:YcxB family protein [Fodinicola feengrottensis]
MILVLLGGYLLFRVRIGAAVAWRRIAKMPAGQWAVRITEGGIEEITPVGREQHPWTSIRKVTHTDSLFVFRVAVPAGVIGIPRASMSMQDTRDLHDLLVRHGLRQAWPSSTGVPN